MIDNQNNKLIVYDSEQIMGMRLEPTRYCVDTLLPQGLCILGGSPKVGKSWLVLDLCMSIAAGQPFWNMATTQGPTLYLCLEDSTNRIQRRLFAQEMEETPDAYFATAAGTLADGLLPQLEEFCVEHDGTRLIVIDTLQLIRHQSQDVSYSGDYAELHQLKALADELETTILVVHHLRKQSDRDPLNKLSGTTGIAGAVDALYILEKKERIAQQATLTCTGRDIEDRVLDLQFSKDICRWSLLSDSLSDPTVPLPEEMRAFYEFMKTLIYFDGGNTELALAFKAATGVDMSAKMLKQTMRKHAAALDRLGIIFTCHRSNGKRFVKVRYIPEADESLQSDASDGRDAYNAGSERCVPVGTCDPALFEDAAFPDRGLGQAERPAVRPALPAAVPGGSPGPLLTEEEKVYA